MGGINAKGGDYTSEDTEEEGSGRVAIGTKKGLEERKA